jgi:hypothetical protein
MGLLFDDLRVAGCLVALLDSITLVAVAVRARGAAGLGLGFFGADLAATPRLATAFADSALTGGALAEAVLVVVRLLIGLRAEALLRGDVDTAIFDDLLVFFTPASCHAPITIDSSA